MIKYEYNKKKKQLLCLNWITSFQRGALDLSLEQAGLHKHVQPKH